MASEDARLSPVWTTKIAARERGIGNIRLLFRTGYFQWMSEHGTLEHNDTYLWSVCVVVCVCLLLYARWVIGCEWMSVWNNACLTMAPEVKLPYFLFLKAWGRSTHRSLLIWITAWEEQCHAPTTKHAPPPEAELDTQLDHIRIEDRSTV